MSINVKLEFPLKDILEYLIAIKKWDENQSIFNFLLHVTGTTQYFLRSNQLEMWYVYLHICETQAYSCTGNAISGIPHPKF